MAIETPPFSKNPSSSSNSFTISAISFDFICLNDFPTSLLMNIGTMVDSVLVDAILDLGGVTWGDGNLSSGWGYVFAAFFMFVERFSHVH